MKIGLATFVLMYGCAPQLDMHSGTDLPLRRRWAVECLSESGVLAVVVTASAARPTDRCGEFEPTDMPDQDDCDSIRDAYAQVCRPGGGPIAGTAGGFTSWMAGDQLAVDEEGNVESGRSLAMWLSRCGSDGTAEVELIDVTVDLVRTGDDSAHVDLGGELQAADASFEVTYCPL